jgi:hypothetical protein
LFPPYVLAATGDVRFAFVLGPPGPPPATPESLFRNAWHVDSGRLQGLQFGVIALTIAALALLADRKSGPVAETFD